VHSADTSITGRTALFHPPVHILSFKYEKARKVADSLRILYDTRYQFLAYYSFRHQSILLEGSALCPANFLVKFMLNIQNKKELYFYVKYIDT